MRWVEIQIPKQVRPFMLEKAEETKLGQKNGSHKQYRYGNLHIREYEDKYVVHMDKIDPRKDPLGHIILDAPEVLVGLTSAAIGSKIASSIYKTQNSKFKLNSVLAGFLAAVTLGYAGYSLTKIIKNF
ncbi:MAG: conserved hypothetical protein [Marine Group I thaumarchaeote]|nr:MAG: conserved hypothetical protein [Marine Group I thaumarchaeote]